MRKYLTIRSETAFDDVGENRDLALLSTVSDKLLCGPKNHSELIPRARKIEFESCKEMKNGQILNFRKKSGGIIRPTVIFFFFETFSANSSGGFEGLETFFGKKVTSISLHFPFHFPFIFSHLLSSSLIFSHLLRVVVATADHVW